MKYENFSQYSFVKFHRPFHIYSEGLANNSGCYYMQGLCTLLFDYLHAQQRSEEGITLVQEARIDPSITCSEALRASIYAKRRHSREQIVKKEPCPNDNHIFACLENNHFG